MIFFKCTSWPPITHNLTHQIICGSLNLGNSDTLGDLQLEVINELADCSYSKNISEILDINEFSLI